MKKYTIIAALFLALCSCMFEYIRSQTTHSNINTTDITEEPTQSTTSPPKQQASQQPSPTPAPALSVQSETAPSAEMVNCLTKKEQKYNQTILNNLVEFQELANQFCRQSDTTQSEELLMASFLRCGEDRYTDEAWSKLVGDCEEFKHFLEKADNNQSAFDLQETKFCYDPVTGDQIDFIHLMATLNVYLSQELIYEFYPEAKDIGGWAGDCIQLAGEAKEAKIAKSGLEKFMKERLGITGKFGMGDVLADIDALNIYKELEEGAEFPAVWESYYNSLGKGTRYKKFVNHRFPDVKSEEQLKKEILSILAPESSLAISEVCQQEGLEQQDGMFCKAAGECFAEYLWKLK